MKSFSFFIPISLMISGLYAETPKDRLLHLLLENDFNSVLAYPGAKDPTICAIQAQAAYVMMQDDQVWKSEECMISSNPKWLLATQMNWGNQQNNPWLQGKFNIESFGPLKLLVSDLVAEGSKKNGNGIKLNQALQNAPAITQWWIMGSFPNFGGLGMHREYGPELQDSPEQILALTNGSNKAWHKILTQDPTGWTYLDDFTNEYHAVNYLATQIDSKKEQDLFLSIGISGTFKIWWNGELVGQDLQYRNTGTDAYRIPIKVKNGPNIVVLKLGHLSRPGSRGQASKANFRIGFLDGKNNGVAFPTQKPYGPNFKKITSQVVNKNLNPYSHAHEFINIQHEDSTLGRILRIRAMLQTSYPLEAENEFKILIQQWPNSSLVWTLGSKIAAALEDASLTEERLQNASKNSYYNYLAKLSNFSKTSKIMSKENLEKSLSEFPEKIQNESILLLLTQFAIAAKNEDQQKIVKTIENLEKNIHDESARKILIALSTKTGRTKNLESELYRAIKTNHGDPELLEDLVQVLVSQGRINDALLLIKQELSWIPDQNRFRIYASQLNIQNKNIQDAERWANECVTKAPLWENCRIILAGIASMNGNTTKALDIINESQNLGIGSFRTYDQKHTLQNKKDLFSQLKYPSRDSLLLVAKSLNNDTSKGIFLSRIHDVVRYPFGRSKSRDFYSIYINNEEAINRWKEVNLGYNRYYQTYEINRAVVIQPDGAEFQADRNAGQLVFKNLSIGSVIEFESKTENYYNDDLWNHTFDQFHIPSKNTVLSGIFRIVGNDDQVIKITSPKEAVESQETLSSGEAVQRFDVNNLSPINHAFYTANATLYKRTFTYSSIKNWQTITDWYSQYVEATNESKGSLQHVADSIFRDLKTPNEKAKAVHNLITQRIKYSMIPFRQSGWIPQDPLQVYRTGLGDCKDMSFLAKTLLDLGQVQANVILVNTSVRSDIEVNLPSPMVFDHAIVSFMNQESKWEEMDLTDASMQFGRIPLVDQGAISLRIAKNQDSLKYLKMDQLNDRLIERTYVDTIYSNNKRVRSTTTLRKGIHAGDFRGSYRNKTPAEWMNRMQKITSADLNNLKVDTMFFDYGLNHLSDSLIYTFKWQSPHGVTEAGDLIIAPILGYDHVSKNMLSATQNRSTDFDPNLEESEIGIYRSFGKIFFPKEWKVMSLPNDTVMKSKFGTYTIKYILANQAIIIQREYKKNVLGILDSAESLDWNQFNTAISNYDNKQIVFNNKGLGLLPSTRNPKEVKPFWQPQATPNQTIKSPKKKK
jgi:hypothetical protein